MKKKLAVAVTVALLAFPLSTTLTMADTEIPTTTASVSATTDTTAEKAEAAVAAYEAGSITTLAKITTAEGLKAAADTAVAAVGDVTAKTAFEFRVTNRAVAIASAKTVLQAEAAVADYEAGSITTLAKIATAEGLKAAADTAVAAVGDVTAKTAFEFRVTNRAAAIATAKTTFQAEAAVAAVADYEAGPITTLAKIAKAEGLKAAADTAVAAVGDVAAKTAFELRVTNRAAAIATAKTVLQAEAAVAAYEAGSITTLAKIATAEGLKAAADTAVAAVDDVTAKTAFKLRITNRAAEIATAKTNLAPVVDADGNTVTPANWFTDLIGKLQLALAFDPARKCELNERHALAKLAEAQKLMENEKLDAAQNCLNQYTDKIAKAQAFLEQVEDPTSETAKILTKDLVNVDSNNIQVLSNLLDKIPPQAAQKVALNVVRSMEKAVTKIQKEEAKIAPETTSATTPATTPVITPVTDSKTLEKQAKVSLENFKKSMNQKGKIHIEDQDNEDQEDNEDKNVVEQSKPEKEKQSLTQNQPTHVTIAPVKPQTAPTVTRQSEHDRDDRNARAENGKNKSGDKEDNHRDNK